MPTMISQIKTIRYSPLDEQTLPGVSNESVRRSSSTVTSNAGSVHSLSATCTTHPGPHPESSPRPWAELPSGTDIRATPIGALPRPSTAPPSSGSTYCTNSCRCPFGHCPLRYPRTLTLQQNLRHHCLTYNHLRSVHRLLPLMRMTRIPPRLAGSKSCAAAPKCSHSQSASPCPCQSPIGP